jgi:hypothetical protein
VLHLRVICQAEQTDEILGLLRDQPGAAHVVLHRGAAVVPPGDVIEADVAREAADQLITALCGLGVDHTGGITLEQVDTALSDAADEAEEAAPGDGADAVVWEELLVRTGEESRLNVTFLAFMAIACLLAAVGVITDSPITLVGAMVVGPEFGPLAALAVGLARRRWDLVRRASMVLAVGFPLAMLVTAGGTALGSAAVLAGAAGMLSMTSAKSAALVGVFISVTTIPAAGYASVAAILGEWSRFFGSVGQLAVNLVGIVVAAVVVLLVRRGTWTVPDAGRPLATG